MKMIYLIVGRSGSGKDYLANLLQSKGLKVVKSYTTRPKRYESEDTHIFVSKEEADAITDKVATTTINGYEYFATKSQVEGSDVYIIDPNGVAELTKNMPETSFHIVHVTADDTDRELVAINRSENPKQEKEIFVKRNADENAQFTEFEEKLKIENSIADNILAVHNFHNDYNKESAEIMVQQLITYKELFENVKAVISECIEFGILNSKTANHITTMDNQDSSEHDMPIELATDTMLAHDDSFAYLMQLWLMHKKILPQHVIREDDDESSYINCPTCHYPLAMNDDYEDTRPKYCPECGTKLIY